MIARWPIRARRSSLQRSPRSREAGSPWAPELGYEDERPPHPVFVDGFELAVCPVTRAEYECFVDATKPELPRDWSHPLFAQADLPVVGVSWIDAVAYCAWRSEQDGRPRPVADRSRVGIRRPRADKQALFPWGDVMPEWIPNGGRGPFQAPWPVTLGEPTAFGLLGIATNVHEWCADWHDKDYYSRSPERNPAGPDQGVRRAARGGAWRHAHTICRVTLAQQARSVLPLQRLWVPPRAKHDADQRLEISMTRDESSRRT